MQSVPSAVPAAESVDMHHNRNNNGEEEEEGSVVFVEMKKKISAPSPPSSPKSFNSDEIFEDIDVEYGDEGSSERISDHDLDRLLGPLPTQNNRRSGNSNTHSSLETDICNNDNGSDNDSRNRRRKIGSKKIKGLCPCCPQSIRQGPCHLLASVIGRDGPVPIVGHMIVVLPKCYYSWGFGIMGPHWYVLEVCICTIILSER